MLTNPCLSVGLPLCLPVCLSLPKAATTDALSYSEVDNTLGVTCPHLKESLLLQFATVCYSLLQFDRCCTIRNGYNDPGYSEMLVVISFFLKVYEC